MTRDEILRIEAGPKLDRLVAEQVMKWRAWESSSPQHWAEEKQGVLVPTGWTINGKTNNGPVWSPSTDIAAAWQVVEERRKWGWAWELAGITGHWHVELYDEECKPIAEANAASAMVAICRAALLALMERV